MYMGHAIRNCYRFPRGDWTDDTVSPWCTITVIDVNCFIRLLGPNDRDIGHDD